jgi:hypothetical protein
MLADCPAFPGHDGAAQWGLPAEVEGRYTVTSTGGPPEGARIRWPRGHWFNGLIESLSAPEPSYVAAVSALQAPLTVQKPQHRFPRPLGCAQAGFTACLPRLALVARATYQRA